MLTRHCSEVLAWGFQLGSHKQSLQIGLTVSPGGGGKSQKRPSSGLRRLTQQSPGGLPGRCPWFCRILGRPCALPAGSCRRPPTVRQNTTSRFLTPMTTPGLSSLSPSGRFQAGHFSKTLSLYFLPHELSVPLRPL